MSIDLIKKRFRFELTVIHLWFNHEAFDVIVNKITDILAGR